jgi:hypothetical protein
MSPKRYDSAQSRTFDYGTWQAMHYKYFLDRMVTHDHPFPWHQIWQRALADPLRSFTYPYFRQTTKPAKHSPTLSADLLRVRCLNDLVDIWTRLLKTHRISGVNIALKLVTRGKGRGPRAFEADLLQMTTDTEEVTMDITYDKTMVVAMINRAVDYWAGKRPPEHGPTFGDFDCRCVY